MRMKNKDAFDIHYPSVRQFTADTGKLGKDKHDIRAFLEVDVSDALQGIKALRAAGRKITFLAWFIKLLADTVVRHPPINGIKKGRNKVRVFNDVNIATVVEKMVDGVQVPLPLLLRDANQKDVLQLDAEIRDAISQAVDNEMNLVLGKGENRLLMQFSLAMPQWMRLWVMRTFILHNPRRMHNMMGTVMVSSLGTVGRLTGWIMPASMHPLSIGLGSLSKKAVIHQGKIQKRSILHLTIALDHDVIDGMPALRFVDDLVASLESGAGLDADQA